MCTLSTTHTLMLSPSSSKHQYYPPHLPHRCFASACRRAPSKPSRICGNSLSRSSNSARRPLTYLRYATNSGSRVLQIFLLEYIVHAALYTSSRNQCFNNWQCTVRPTIDQESFVHTRYKQTGRIHILQFLFVVVTKTSLTSLFLTAPSFDALFCHRVAAGQQQRGWTDL